MRFSEFKTMETDRLLLRRIRMEDIQEYYETLFSDGDVCRYLLFDPHQDIGESLESLEQTLAGYAAGGRYCWGIARKEDDILIGVIGLTHISREENSCSFSYLLAKAQWNKGYGTEALKAVLGFAFDDLQVDRVWADHMAENPASGAVMRKAGMEHIGTAQEKYRKHGFLHDAEMYELRCPREMFPDAGGDRQQAALRSALTGLRDRSAEAAALISGPDRDQAPDREVLKESLAEIARYLSEAACALGFSLEDILGKAAS